MTISPCIWMDDRAEEAARFYAGTFRSARELSVVRYPLGMDNPAHRPPGSVLLVDVELAGQCFTLLNGGPVFAPNPSISFFVHAESAEEVDRLYAALSDGGAALMPPGEYPWSPRYAWVQDRYGVSWQLMAGRRDGQATLVPCLMFAGDVAGFAREAISFYTRSLPAGRMGRLESYAPGEGPVAFLKHGRFAVAGVDLVAMDSHVPHAFAFNEGVSLQLLCDSQAELDAAWEKLGEGGTHGPCGWLKDRFGISWQVVPAALSRWFQEADEAGRARLLTAVWAMTKLDVRSLEAATRR